MGKSSTSFKKGQTPWNKGKPFLVGDKNPMFGKHHTDKTKELISKANKGNPPTKTSFVKGYKGKNGIENPMYGRIGKLNPFFGKKHSEQTKKKLSKNASKKILGKNPNWKGGLSFQPYGLEFDNKLREKVRQRDNFKCQFCFKHENEFNRKLSIHHIDYNKQNNDSNNLISLCVGCHLKTNKNRLFWQRYFAMYHFIKQLQIQKQSILINESSGGIFKC